MSKTKLSDVVKSGMIYRCLTDIPCVENISVPAGTLVYIDFTYINPRTGAYSNKKYGVKYIELLDVEQYVHSGHTSIDDMESSNIPYQITGDNFHYYFEPYEGLTAILKRKTKEYKTAKRKQKKINKVSIAMMIMCGILLVLAGSTFGAAKIFQNLFTEFRGTMLYISLILLILSILVGVSAFALREINKKRYSDIKHKFVVEKKNAYYHFVGAKK